MIVGRFESVPQVSLAYILTGSITQAIASILNNRHLRPFDLNFQQ